MEIKNEIVIRTITAFVSVDKDGNEGVIGQLMPDGKWMPFICADETRIQTLLPFAIEVSRMTKIPFKILQFGTRTDLTEKYTKEYNDAIRNARQN